MNKLQFIFICILSVMFIFPELQANSPKQTYTDTTFLIEIEIVENHVQLTSKKGCDFKELSLNLHNDTVYFIDEHGMHPSNNMKPNKPQISSFLFSISKTSEGILLHGLIGTQWENLVLKPNNGRLVHYINQEGNNAIPVKAVIQL